MKEPVSQEYTNAFVDGELAVSEREEALARMESDPDFKRAVCEARIMKERVRAAYAAEKPAKRPVFGFNCPPAWRQAIAAGLLLSLGLGGGWWAHDVSKQDGPVRVAGLPEGYVPVSLASQADPGKVVLHLDSGEPERLTTALDLAERLIGERGDDARVEIVVNSYGINLLRADVSPQRGRIESLARRHANLVFLACGQTLARMRREGIEVALVPEAGIASSAIHEILTRLGQGWVYVKV